MEILITARGHKNITAKHKTTIEITKDTHLTSAGDCIVAVDADKSFSDFSEKDIFAMQMGTITVAFEYDSHVWSVTGRGDPALAMSHPSEMVIRKSTFCCPRTLLIEADKAACDMPRDMINAFRDPDARIVIRIQVTGRQDNTPAHRSNHSGNPQDFARDDGKA